MKTGLALLFVFTGFALPAQDKIARTCPTGVYVTLGNEIPKAFSYRISRKTNKGNYQEIAAVSFPDSKDEWVSRVKQSGSHFELLGKPDTRETDRIWKEITEEKKTTGLMFQSFAIEALASGMAWLDSDAEKGKEYTYKIDKVEGNTTIHTVESNVIIAGTKTSLPQPSFLKAEFVLNKLRVEWILFDRTGVSGFTMMRRDNLKGDFRKINTTIGYRMNLDTTFVIIQDTLVAKHEVYEYKIQPHDWLGNEGQPTNIAKAITFSTYDFPTLRSFTTHSLDNRQIKLKWSLDNPPFLRSIKIMRSMTFDNDFVEIAEVSPLDSTYVDVLPVSMENYFYRLVLNGPDGISLPTAATSGTFQSTDMPLPPLDLRAHSMKDGIALFWSDRQNNVLGYKVYRGTAWSGFQLVSDVPYSNTTPLHYQDTSRALKGDRTYHYVIKTVSDSYVESVFSDTVMVRPGIPVPVRTPNQLKARRNGDKVYLVWEDITQHDHNAGGYHVFRKTSTEDTYTALTRELLPAYTNHFIDTTLEQGFVYHYTIRAYSRFGDESAPGTVAEIAYYLPMPVPPPGIQVHATATGVQLSWGTVMNNDLMTYIVYKQRPGDEIMKVGEVTPDRTYYLDNNAVKGEHYFYYVSTKNVHEIESPKSEPVFVRY